jgi:hypothetical protein
MGCLICVVILLAWVSVTLADTVSEEAQRYMARGMAAVEMAKTPKDYKRAVLEFEQAAKLAPNWPDVYFNLGSVQAKAALQTLSRTRPQCPRRSECPRGDLQAGISGRGTDGEGEAEKGTGKIQSGGWGYL